MAYLRFLNDQIEYCDKQIAEAQVTLAKAQEAKKALTDKAWYCPACKKYYDKADCSKHNRQQTSVETVYIDAGYGDDDELAEVTRMVTFIECPVCGHQEQDGKGIYLSEKNRHTRR